MWTRTYDETVEDVAYSVQQTTDSGYIITGCIGFNSPDVYIIKTDINGDTLWTRIYGGGFIDTIDAEGYEVQQTIDGGYIIVGHKEVYNSGNRDVYLIKIDANGDSLWTKTFGGTGWDVGFSVKQTSDGGYIITGEKKGDVYLIKTDSQGDTLWTKTYGGTDSDYGASVDQTTDGGYIIVGLTMSFGVGWFDVYLVKTDSNGDTLWTQNYGPGYYNATFSVQQTTDGGYIVAGYTDSTGENEDVYLIKTKPDVGIKKQKEDLRHETSDMRFICHPNPFTTSTTINFPRISEDQNTRVAELKIYDASGRLVKSVPLTTNHLSLGTDLKAGIYFLKLNDKSVGKVVKVR